MAQDIAVSADGWLEFAGRRYACALGAGGVRAIKTEGDNATPAGCFALRRVLYRPDRVAMPPSLLPIAAMTEADGWCDDPADPAYNRQVVLPYVARHEALWREDHVYDVLVVLGHNDDPPVPGKGSAIFLHVAKSDYAPTAGCVALGLADLLSVLRDCAPETRLCIRD